MAHLPLPARLCSRLMRPPLWWVGLLSGRILLSDAGGACPRHRRPICSTTAVPMTRELNRLRSPLASTSTVISQLRPSGRWLLLRRPVRRGCGSMAHNGPTASGRMVRSGGGESRFRTQGSEGDAARPGSLVACTWRIFVPSGYTQRPVPCAKRMAEPQGSSLLRRSMEATLASKQDQQAGSA